VDVDSEECLQLASEGRSSFHAYVFLKEVLKYCENKPEIVDRGFINGLCKGLVEVQT